jgi:hypothetical protein
MTQKFEGVFLPGFYAYLPVLNLVKIRPARQNLSENYIICSILKLFVPQTFNRVELRRFTCRQNAENQTDGD